MGPADLASRSMQELNKMADVADFAPQLRGSAGLNIPEPSDIRALSVLPQNSGMPLPQGIAPDPTAMYPMMSGISMNAGSNGPAYSATDADFVSYQNALQSLSGAFAATNASGNPIAEMILSVAAGSYQENIDGFTADKANGAGEVMAVMGQGLDATGMMQGDNTMVLMGQMLKAAGEIVQTSSGAMPPPEGMTTSEAVTAKTAEVTGDLMIAMGTVTGNDAMVAEGKATKEGFNSATDDGVIAGLAENDDFEVDDIDDDAFEQHECDDDDVSAADGSDQQVARTMAELFTTMGMITNTLTEMALRDSNTGADWANVVDLVSEGLGLDVAAPVNAFEAIGNNSEIESPFEWAAIATSMIAELPASDAIPADLPRPDPQTSVPYQDAVEQLTTAMGDGPDALTELFTSDAYIAAINGLKGTSLSSDD